MDAADEGYSRMCHAKLDSYVFFDVPVFYSMDAPDEGYSRDVSY